MISLRARFNQLNHHKKRTKENHIQKCQNVFALKTDFQ